MGDIRYLTDHIRLFEVLKVDEVQNFGRTGGWIRTTYVQDCVTDEVRVFNDVDVALCDPVRRAA